MPHFMRVWKENKNCSDGCQFPRSLKMFKKFKFGILTIYVTKRQNFLINKLNIITTADR